MTITRTTNYGFEKPDFNQPTWGDEITRFMDSVDALIEEGLQVAAVVGVWANSTLYEVGDRVVDDDDGSVYTCIVENTSPSSGTFASYRTSNPTHWEPSTQVLTARGEWANDTVYNKNDLVYDINEGVSAICTTTHTSGSSPDTIRDDSANWAFIIDISAGTVTAANTTYDNSSSGMTADDVQDAIDELDASIDSILTSLTTKANLASPAFTGNPTVPTQATSNESTRIASTQYVANKILAQGVLTNYTVRGATTANIDLSNALEDGDTLDGLTLATGDKILVKDQTDATQNGIYTVVASGAASRHADFDTWDEHVNKVVNVTAGTANAGTSWRSLANTGGTLGSDDIEFLAFGTALTVPIGITEGGTGEITAAAAFAALKQAASATATGVVELATDAETITGTDTARAITPANLQAKLDDVGVTVASQAEMEAASATNRIVTPGRLHYHPGVAKCWAYVTVPGGTPTLQSSYNVGSVTDVGVGELDITIATDFSSSNWCPQVACQAGGTVADKIASYVDVLAGVITLLVYNVGSGLDDPTSYAFVGYGDHA